MNIVERDDKMDALFKLIIGVRLANEGVDLLGGWRSWQIVGDTVAIADGFGKGCE